MPGPIITFAREQAPLRQAARGEQNPWGDTLKGATRSCARRLCLPPTGPIFAHPFGHLQPFLGAHRFAAAALWPEGIHYPGGGQFFERRDYLVELLPFRSQLPQEVVIVHGWIQFLLV